MKLIVAAAITLGALVLGTGVAHADDNSDYINNLKSHGLSPAAGASESQWETGAIQVAHEVCGLAAAGNSRDRITARFTAQHPDNGNAVRIMVDAAEATYCPQYWGQQ